MSARVLVIEDNPVNAELVVYLLQALGLRAEVAGDGLAGLAAARRERPDLILCDIQMPLLDGHAFARIAKAELGLREVPLLAVTASAMVGDRDRILAAGFDGYIAKPIQPQALADQLCALLAAACARRPDAGAADVPASVGPAASARHRPCVLVLDDTPWNLELKRDLLQPRGYEVLTACTADEAIALAQCKLPQLIVSDVGLQGAAPSTGGLEFLRRVKADPRLARVPFVFITATHWDEPTRRAALALGADRYLHRPMAPDAVLAVLEACLDEARTAGRLG